MLEDSCFNVSYTYFSYIKYVLANSFHLLVFTYLNLHYGLSYLILSLITRYFMLPDESQRHRLPFLVFYITIHTRIRAVTSCIKRLSVPYYLVMTVFLLCGFNLYGDRCIGNTRIDLYRCRKCILKF